ncbi:MAG TPA: hypothetical protein PKN30_10705, partial [Flavobacteriales bacterium]|nr:hypothetical protein [Flavobacteriales bacterium]
MAGQEHLVDGDVQFLRGMLANPEQGCFGVLDVIAEQEPFFRIGHADQQHFIAVQNGTEPIQRVLRRFQHQAIVLHGAMMDQQDIQRIVLRLHDDGL